MSEIAQEYSVHPTQIGVWKKMLTDQTVAGDTITIAS
jgi:transposase-like protein